MTARSKNPLLKVSSVMQWLGFPKCLLPVFIYSNFSPGTLRFRPSSAGTRGAVAGPVMAHAARWGQRQEGGIAFTYPM